jgi:antitoxin component YwqK of YwqJK toxin-antitoxin module
MKIKYILLVLLSINLFSASAKKKELTIADGEKLIYRKDGTLKEKAYYGNGLLTGTRYLYFKDGKTIKQSTDYVNGKKSGMERYYGKLGLLRDFKEH